MWFAERPRLGVGLLEDCVAIARRHARAGAGPVTEVVSVGTAADGAPAWQPSVAALSQWLRECDFKHACLEVFLSGHFVRWQLVPWQPRLTRRDEITAHAQLRFRATFGPAADGWRVIHAEPTPGQAMVACAVDEALLSALAELPSTAQAHVTGVVPYFAAVYDRWRARLGRRCAWFGVVEPTHLTLGLLHHGRWHGLRSVRHRGAGEGSWRAIVAPLQAQMGLGAGLDLRSDAPMFLADCAGAPNAGTAPDVVWLAPVGKREPARGVERMAWGV